LALNPARATPLSDVFITIDRATRESKLSAASAANSFNRKIVMRLTLLPASCL
jgi:hypothetical protein